MTTLSIGRHKALQKRHRDVVNHTLKSPSNGLGLGFLCWRFRGVPRRRGPLVRPAGRLLFEGAIPEVIRRAGALFGVVRFFAPVLGHLLEALPLSFGRELLELPESLPDGRALFRRRIFGALVHPGQHAALLRRQIVPDRRILRPDAFLEFGRWLGLGHAVDFFALFFGRQLLKFAGLFPERVLVLRRRVFQLPVKAPEAVPLFGRKLLPIFEVLLDPSLLRRRELLKPRALFAEFLPFLGCEFVEALAVDPHLGGLWRQVGVRLRRARKS